MKKKAQVSKSFDFTKFIKLGELLVSLVTIAVWFAAILAVATCLGWGMHHLPHWAPWTPSWMLKLGHWVEGFLFVADMVSLVVAVCKEVWEHAFHGNGHHAKGEGAAGAATSAARGK